MAKKLVITGMGVISPIGHNIADFSANLFAGKSGIAALSFTHRGQEVHFPGAAVKDFKPETWMDAKKVPLLDRFSQFAVAAALQAVKDSGLVIEGADAERTGVIIGTGVGGQNTIEESYNKLLLGEGTPRVHPFTIPRLMANAGSSQISMATGATGPCFTIASACASGIHAMGVAISMLRSGLMDRVITGGAESCLTFGTLKGWEALRVMAPDVPRPFSRDRAGMVIGEGAGMLMIETLESAEARGAKIYGELLGFGMSADAKDITTPDVTGAGRAVINVLKDAQLKPEDVDYINAHGTGTRVNDLTETQVIKNVFGDHAKKLALSASKSMFGHALGAAGALEMLATVLSITEQKAPPTMNYLGQDPECDLDYVPNVARHMKINIALNNSFAFGGLNAVVAVKKFA